MLYWNVPPDELCCTGISFLTDYVVLEYQVFCKSAVDGSDKDELLLHDGTFLPDIQPDIPGVTFGAGIPNFASFTFGGEQRECLTNFPGLTDMWWDVHGVSYPSKADGTPFAEEGEAESAAGGTMAFSGGMVWFTPPPKAPPLVPEVQLVDLDYAHARLLFASTQSEGGDAIIAYVVQADTDQDFGHAIALGVEGATISDCGYINDAAMCHAFTVGAAAVVTSHAGVDSVPDRLSMSEDCGALGAFEDCASLSYPTLPMEPGNLYYLRVVAFDGTSFSEWSSIKTVLTQSSPAKSAVRVVKVVQDAGGVRQQGFFEDRVELEAQGEDSPNGEAVLGIEVQVNVKKDFSSDMGSSFILDVSGQMGDGTGWCDTLTREGDIADAESCAAMLPFIVDNATATLQKCSIIESLSGCWILDWTVDANLKGRELYVRARSHDSKYYGSWSDVDGPFYFRVLDEVDGTMVKLAHVFAAVGMAFSAIVSVCIYIFRNHRVIKRASPAFCVLVCVGAICALLSVFFGNEAPTPRSCKTHYSLLFIGFSLVIGPQFSKTWRIMKILTGLKNFRRHVITDYQVAAFNILYCNLPAVFTLFVRQHSY